MRLNHDIMQFFWFLRNLVFKIILIGDAEVGKSSLALQVAVSLA